MRTASAHSLERMKERCNIKNSRTAERNVRLALERGKRANEFKSWEKVYLETEAYSGCTAIAYNNLCYIVNEENVCVTVYKLPAWFGKKKHFTGKERIRDYKKFCRSNHYPFES